MVPVIVATLSIVGAVLAGLVPLLAMSQQRRLLRLISEEREALAEVDDESRELLLIAHRATVDRYRWLATESRAQVARRRFVYCVPVGYLLIIGAIGLSTLAVSADNKDDAQKFALAAGAVALLGIIPLAVLYLMAISARSGERRRDTELARAKEALVDAERELGEIDTTLKEVVLESVSTDGLGETAAQFVGSRAFRELQNYILEKHRDEVTAAAGPNFEAWFAETQRDPSDFRPRVEKVRPEN